MFAKIKMFLTHVNYTKTMPMPAGDAIPAMQRASDTVTIRKGI